MTPASRATRCALPVALLVAVLAVPTAATAQPTPAAAASPTQQATWSEQVEQVEQLEPVPVTGHSDLGDWTSGTPLPTSAGSSLAAPEATTSAEAAAVADLTASITRKLGTRAKDTRLGSSWSGQVVDLGTGKALWSKSASTARLPASNQKLVTAFVALKSLGGATTLKTPVLQGSTYKSSIYLKGVGDPSLSSARLKTLANAAAYAVKSQKISVVNVYVDDSLFPTPTNATGWKAAWVPEEVAPVRPLVVDQVNVMDTSMAAGQLFASKLRAAGVPVKSVRRGKVEARSTTLATTSSPTVGAMVAVMLNVSHNDYAETLYRLAAVKRGYRADWAGAKANALNILTTHGVNRTGLSFYDGSGLSRSDRMTVSTAISLLKRMRQQSDVNPWVFGSGGMPVAGVSGTLKDRFRTAPTSCAKGIVRAKTGTLSDVVALSGIAQGKDGKERLFSILVNANTRTTSARAAVDALAATSTGCY
jgi:D-alanyl-D-alanine carboxypeptidase/D-alanyl-D-alanine-endopeptidase (penicillin-binding protein 4)